MCVCVCVCVCIVMQWEKNKDFKDFKDFCFLSSKNAMDLLMLFLCLSLLWLFKDKAEP